MYSITRPPRSVHTPAPARQQFTGRLLITVIGTGETAIQALGITEAEGDASHQLAERLRPELDALAAAVRNGAAR